MPNEVQVAVQRIGKPRARITQPLHAAQLSDALLRMATVEAVTGLCRSTIYAKIKSGEFAEPIRIGSRCSRWKSSDVRAWLEAQSQ